MKDMSKILSGIRQRRKEHEKARRERYWYNRAREVVTVGYTADNETAIFFGRTPIYVVTEDTDISSGTIALSEVNSEVTRLRGLYYKAHKEMGVMA